MCTLNTVHSVNNINTASAVDFKRTYAEVLNSRIDRLYRKYGGEGA